MARLSHLPRLRLVTAVTGYTAIILSAYYLEREALEGELLCIPYV